MIPYEFSDLSVKYSEKDDRIVSILNEHHYAGIGRPAKAYYIAEIADKIVCVCKFASVVRLGVAKKEGFDHSEVLELDRLCAHPDYQKKNLMSWFLSRVIKHVKTDFHAIRLLVSFADTEQGHFGGVYRASNWTPCGITRTSYNYIGTDGKTINKKTLYNWACRDGMSEKDKAASLGLSKSILAPKIKFKYCL